jgi:hypothetical protein
MLIAVSLPLTLYAADQPSDQAQRPQIQTKAKAQGQQQIYGSQRDVRRSEPLIEPLAPLEADPLRKDESCTPLRTPSI